MLDPKIRNIREFRREESGYLIEDVHIGSFEVKSRYGRMFTGFASFGRGPPRPVYVGLGSDFLEQFRLTIDYPRHLVVLDRGGCPLERP